jgi:hypothetical protein
MRTVTLRLPEALVDRIEAEAKSRRLTKSEVVRRKLEAGAGSEPVSDTWAAAEELLKEAWAAPGTAVRESYENPQKQRTLDAIRREKQRR